MDWIEKILTIKKILKKSGFDDAVKRINDAQMVLGTPGEMYLEVMNELLFIKHDSPAAYKLIEKEVNELADYGRSLNYFNFPM